MLRISGSVVVLLLTLRGIAALSATKVQEPIVTLEEAEAGKKEGVWTRLAKPYVKFFQDKIQEHMANEDTQEELELIKKKVIKKLDPRINKFYEQPLTQDILHEFVWPYLDEVLPGGLPNATSPATMIATDGMGAVSSDHETAVQLEASTIKLISKVAKDEPVKLRELLEPKIKEYVRDNWDGNNNTKEFYTNEQVKLLQLAIKQEGLLYPPFTQDQLSNRALLTGLCVAGPVLVWIALLVVGSMYKKQQEEIAPISPQAADNEKRFFPHLDGMRTVAAMIIVWFHYSGILGPYSMVAAQDNWVKPRFSPVSFFLVLSGFCMHYAYCKKVYRNLWDVAKYMINRLGRVAPSYWAAWFMFFIVMHPQISPIIKRGNEYWVEHFNKAAFCSFFMLQSWTEWAFTYTPEALTPTQQITGQRNQDGGDGYAGDFGNLWTVSTLLLPWLIYPLLHLVVTRTAKASSFWGLRALTVATYLLGVAPALYLYWTYGDELRSKSVYTLKVNPVFLLPQFVLGMCTAQLLKQAEEDPHGVNYVPKWIHSLLGDLAITGTFFFVLVVPFKWFDRGFEVMFIGGEAHLIAAYLYFSCLPGVGKGVWTAFASSPIMVKLGEYAMHVYLLQYPFAAIMDAAINGLPADPRPSFSSWTGQFQLLLGLWAMSIIFAEMLDKPMQGALAKIFAAKK